MYVIEVLLILYRQKDAHYDRFFLQDSYWFTLGPSQDTDHFGHDFRTAMLYLSSASYLWKCVTVAGLLYIRW
jgi:hypothetical protein